MQKADVLTWAQGVATAIERSAKRPLPLDEDEDAALPARRKSRRDPPDDKPLSDSLLRQRCLQNLPPTPPMSTRHRQPSTPTRSSGTKRSLEVDDQAQPSGAPIDTDNTPRAPISFSRPSSSVTSSSAPSESNKSLRSSRNSSPRKDQRKAEISSDGHFVHIGLEPLLATDTGIAAVRELQERMVDAPLLPQNMKASLERLGSVVSRAAFARVGDKVADEDYLPKLSRVNTIFRRGLFCDQHNVTEGAWNMEVHSKVLDMAFRVEDESGLARKEDERIQLDYAYCVEARVDDQYRHKGQPSKMVDFCLCLAPSDEPAGRELKDRIDHACECAAQLTINHTNWGNLNKHPIAVSIETKSPSGDVNKGRNQVASWHWSQWRSIEVIRPPTTTTPQLEVLIGIVVHGHGWYLAATPRPEFGGRTTTYFSNEPFGSSASPCSMYVLIIALRELGTWVRTQHWPKFEIDVLAG